VGNEILGSAIHRVQATVFTGAGAGAPKKRPWTGTFSGIYYLQGLSFRLKHLKSTIKTEDI
jgi:hypothetical protein